MNDCYVGMVAVDYSGNLVILTSSDFKGISAKNDEWFDGLREVVNLKDFIKNKVKISID